MPLKIVTDLSKVEGNYRLFIALLIIAVCFVASSTFLIIKVNSITAAVEMEVLDISVAGVVKSSSTQGLKSIREQDSVAVIDQLNYLNYESNLTAEELLRMPEIQAALDTLKLATADLSQVNLDMVDDLLMKTEAISQRVIREKRIVLGQSSVQLDNYWLYTHTLLAIACLLAIYIAYIGLSITKARKRLSKVTEQNSLLLNNSIDCIMTGDKNGNVAEFNATAVQEFGYTKEEVIGKSGKILFALEEEYKMVNQHLEEHGRFTGEIRNRTKSGKIILSYLSANLLYNKAGEVVGSMGVSRNITETKKLEEEFRHIIKNAAEIIYTADFKGNLTYVNTSTRSMLGYSPDDLLGKSYMVVIHPDDQQRVREHYLKQFRNGQTSSYLEFKAIKANGESIWVAQNVKTVFNAVDKTRIDAFHGILRDINDRKEAELKLAISEEKYRELFDNSSDLIQSVNADGKIFYVNETWRRVLGYSEAEIKSMKLFDVVHPDSLEYCKHTFGQIMNGHLTSVRITYDMLTKSGERISVEGNASIKWENDEVALIQSFLRDITLQKKAEEQLEKTETSFKQIIETLNDVFYLYNRRETKYEFMSPNCDVILGVDQDFFYSGGQYNLTFGFPEDKETFEEAAKNVREGIPYDIEYRILVNDEIRWINERSFPIHNPEGEVVLLSGICRDITSMRKASETIYKQNIEIGQSILYAKKIQDSTLPTADEVTNILPESFVFYSPKDILSGDFYIVDHVPFQGNPKAPVMVVADCTGHGVPGGILSLVCNSLIKETFTSRDVHSPSEALEFVRVKLAQFFRSSQAQRIQDGMDVAYCVLNPETMELHYSGAHNSCIIIRRGEIIEYKGDMQHVGYSELSKPFTNHIIKVEKDDCIYLVTDGYLDQFGGPHDRKFMRKRFKKMLSEIYQEPMDLQLEYLKSTFQEWRGNNDQTDDVTALGMRVP